MSENFGHLASVPINTIFATRKEAASAGVHRPIQAGICGTAKSGCDSIVLSGGYEDDSDNGHTILYTGAGGKYPNTNRQIADQQLINGNLSLVFSCDQNIPVRVLRGAKHQKHFDALPGYERFAPPKSGYRYDGLYRVEQYWPDQGRSGFRIWRFRLTLLDTLFDASTGSDQTPDRRTTTLELLIRDTKKASRIKDLYGSACQVCGEIVETITGPYAEAAHIKPLGTPHCGPDKIENLLCLCPNHHVAFARFGFSIADDGFLIGIVGKLRQHPGHKINFKNIVYHREQYQIAQNRTITAPPSENCKRRKIHPLPICR